MGGDGSPLYVLKTIWLQLVKNAPIPSQSFAGQTVIITGSNTGLGFEAAKHIVKLGCSKLIIAVRSLEKGEAAKKSIIETTGCAPEIVEVWPIDLTSYDSVKNFAERANRDLQRVDVLLENAGVASVEWNWVADNERMITVNVISTFLLAMLMLPKLQATATKFNTTPRLTVVTSDSHFMIDFDERNAPEGIFNKLNDKATANTRERYPTSKLIQIFIVRELAARLRGEQATTAPDVIINAVNPGMCKSELSRELDGLAISIMKFILARTTEAGSRILAHGAAGGPDTHGQYMDLGKVEKPATVIIGQGGKETQEKLFTELMAKLESIVPGISKGYD